MKKNVNIFKAFFKLLPMTVKAAPLLFAVTQAVSIIHGLSWGLLTLSQQRFFDSATRLASREIGLSDIVAPFVFLGLIYISTQLLNGISNYLPGRFADKAAGGLSTIIHNKIAGISPADFENTERLDDINKAGEGKDNAVWFVFDFSIIFSFYVPYFTFMAYYLFSLKPVLTVAIIFVFIPTALTQIIRTRVFSRLEDKAAPVRREFEYYEKCIVDREYFKETRMLGGFAFFKKLYLDSLSLMNRLRLKSDTKTNLYELAMQIVTLTGYLAIIWMLFDSLIKREISVGAFAAVFASIGMLFQLMREIISMHLGQMSKNLGTISNFLRFLNIPERTGADVTITPDSGVVVSGVSFTYPQAEGKAIDNMSFTIKHGETVAIVGENGSGKTTLVRLITGLYLPDEGRVYIGGADTSDASMRSLFAETSAVFQKYQRYQMTLGDNISISQAKKSADTDAISADTGALDTASAMSGISTDIPEFTKGYDTMLSREFDGVDLSGGQWQRVAIARGFFREHEFIVLDEPTAAIDPLEETRVYNKFAELSEGKTAFIVTHRLGSVRLADRILVLSGGRLVEEGTHDELLSKDGEYARLYKAQEQWYAL